MKKIFAWIVFESEDHIPDQCRDNIRSYIDNCDSNVSIFDVYDNTTYSFIISVRDNDSNRRESMYSSIKESLSNLISSIPVTVEERIKDTL